MDGERKPITLSLLLLFMLSTMLKAQVVPYQGFQDPIGFTRLFDGRGQPPHDATFSPDHKYLLLSSRTDGITYVYDLTKGRQVRFILPWAAEFVCFTADGKTAYILHGQSFFKTYLAKYETTNWHLLQERTIGDRVYELAINKENNKLLAIAGSVVHILDPLSLATVKVSWENAKLRLVSFNPVNSNQFAAVNRQNHIEIRNLENDMVTSIIYTPSDRIKKLDYLPNGEEILSLDEAGALHIWSLQDSSSQLVLTGVADVRNVSEAGLSIMRNGRWEDLPRHDWSLQSIPDVKTENENAFSDRQNKKIGVAPRPILGYTPETNVLIGLGLNIVFNPKNTIEQLGYTRPSSISPAVSYGFNGQVYMDLLTDYFTKTGWHLVHDMGFLTKNRSYFFAIGNQADRHQRTLYSNDVFMLEGTVSKSIHKRFYGGIRYHLRDDKRLDFADPVVSASAGTHGGILAGLGLLLQYDTRNDLFFPTKGHFVDFTYMRYQKWFGSPYRFDELKLDYRYYFPIPGWAKETSFAIQGLYHNTFGGLIPFYALPYLTADRMIRGVWHNLYIDRQAIAVQGELRSTFSAIDSRYGYVLFGGMGDVANNFLKDYRPRPIGFIGLGLRRQLIPKLRLQSRLDGSVTSRGDLGFFGSVGVAF